MLGGPSDNRIVRAMVPSGGMKQAPSVQRLAYLIGNFPGRVEPFVLNEMKQLSSLGFQIYVCPIHNVPASAADGDGGELTAIAARAVNVLSVIGSHVWWLFSRPAPYLQCLLHHRAYGGKTVFWKAVHFARAVRRLGIQHLHAHFGWTAADCARVLSRLTGLPFSFSVHAADIYYRPDNLGVKLREAQFVLTCVEHNRTYLARIFGKEVAQKISVSYHGVDLERFRPMVAPKVVDALAIGNLVEKKGLTYLIEACAILRERGVAMRCLIVGEGPERERLERLIRALKLERCVRIEGRRGQAELPRLYAESRMFVLPSVITADGDRDGIPNALVEAMAMGVPVISSRLPNITELITHGVDGLLVPSADAAALAGAMQHLLEDEAAGDTLTANARRTVLSRFDSTKNIQRVAELFHASATRGR